MKNSGFSLIELLIVLVIIGILSAIAYPIYTAHIIKTRRAEAKVTLVDLASRLEQYYVMHRNYKGATFAELNFNPTRKKFYRFEMNTSENDFTLLAIPIGPQTKDQQCGTLIYNQKGEKGISGNSTIIAECW
jgi:type IV pilus assembly protein PilE